MLSASLTARSGRWVVASATRSSPRGQHHHRLAARACAAAMYSVWPLKGTPASLIRLFCTGAVTMAANSPARQPSTARSISASTWRALRDFEPSGDAGRRQRLMQHTERAGGVRDFAAAAIVGQLQLQSQPPRPRAPAARDRPGTPAASARAVLATARHRSGPMPARLPGSQRNRRRHGSRAFQSRSFDVGFVADLLQPQLGGFLDAAVAHRLEGTLARSFVGVVEITPPEQLHDVPAVLGAKRLADLAILEARRPRRRIPARTRWTRSSPGRRR